MSQKMDDVIAGRSTERIEDEIAAIYQEAHRVAPGTRVKEVGVLAALWAELDYRLEEEDA